MAGFLKNHTAIKIDGLTKIYTDGNVTAVDDISFKVKKGEIFSFLGPNGAGKSTTISIAATAMDPTDGSVEVFGYDVVNERKEVRKHIGICPQEIVFYQKLTVYENVTFIGKMYDMSKDEVHERSNKLIKELGLWEKRDTIASKLSGGMKRRLNLIMGLINNPDLVFLDEPTAGLDPQTRHLVWDNIKDLKREGKTVFLTTHYMDEADALSDRVAIIDKGKIIALDSPFDLKRQYSSGDLIELKFNEGAGVVKEKIKVLKQNKNYSDIYYAEEDDLLRIAIHNGLKNIGNLIDTLEDLNLNIYDMNVRSNSLENVFIKLTGRSLRD